MAAAEQDAKVTVTVPYEEILTLPLPQLEATLSQGDYSDVQALCKHAGLSAKGSRNELERRVIEHAKEKVDAAPSASPERRDGRARSPKHGKAAAAVRASVVSEAAASKDTDQKPESKMEIDSRLLNAAEAQALGLTSGGATSSGGPRSWPPPPAMPNFNIHTPARAPSAPSVSPELAAARQRLAAVRTELETEKVPTEPSNQDLMNAIQQMSGKMALKEDVEVAKLETVKILRQEIEPVKAHMESLETNVSQALDETKMLNERLTKTEIASTIEFDRVGRLESEVQNLKQKLESVNIGFKRDKFDPAFVRVRFTGFQEKVADLDKIKAIEGFMQKHFKEINVLYTDHFSKKASFIQVSTPKVVKTILDKVKEKGLKLEGHADVKIRQALTSIDLSRNINLYKAEELIKGDAKATGKNVETKSGKERVINVDGKAAFKQDERYDPRGGFVGDFVHLKLS